MFSCESRFQDKSFSLFLLLSSPSFFAFILPSLSLPIYHHLTRCHISALYVKRILWCFQSLFQPPWVRNYLQSSEYKLYCHFFSGFSSSLDSVSFSSSVSKTYLKICCRECEFVSLACHTVLQLANYFYVILCFGLWVTVTRVLEIW